MRFTRTCIILVVIIMGQCPGYGIASGLRNVEDGWFLANKEILQIFSAETSQENDSPGLNSVNGLWASVGSMQLFSMTELPVKIMRIGGRFSGLSSNWNISGQWQRTGNGLFREDGQTLEIGWERKWLVGLSVDRKGWAIGSEPGPAWHGVMFIFEPMPVQIGACKFKSQIRLPIWESSDWRDFEQRQSRFKFSFSYLKMSVGVVWEKKSDMGWAGGLELFSALTSRVGISFRSDPDTGSIGPGTLWLWGRIIFKTSHVVHPELGITHRVTLTTGTLGAVPW